MTVHRCRAPMFRGTIGAVRAAPRKSRMPHRAVLPLIIASLPACYLTLDEDELTGQRRDADNDVADASESPCPDNLVSNSSFEEGTSGWSSVGGSLERS